MGAPNESRGPSRSIWGTIRSLHGRATYGRWFRWHLVLALAAFFASAFAGYAVVGSIPVNQLRELIPSETPLPEVAFAPIAFNNLRVLLIVGLGTVTGGLLSGFVLVVNGGVVGAVVAVVGDEASWPVILAALLPHGVLELSAFFAAAAVGFRVPHRILGYLLGWDETPITRVELFELAVISVVLVAAIVVAAWIEVNVTPTVIRWVGGPNALPS